ncbi:DUF2059 domain-containing protein [Luteimonas sp. SDU82]|uniref:DUF2059 domain-containing protein n=1 Tax=Luteimonas sp. SDU82 TaxID=3422592 RepID=UPI003EC10FF7
MIATALLQARAAEPAVPVDRAEALAKAMEFSEAFEDSLAVCREKARAEDISTLAANSPEAFGGIAPGHELWSEVSNLYLDMLAKGCAHATEPALAAFAGSLSVSLSDEDIDALITFYGTPLGRRYVRASLAANRAAGLATHLLPGSKNAYDEYVSALTELLAANAAPVGIQPDATRPPDARPIPSIDDVVALSDRVMQSVGSDSQAAFDLLRPNSIIAAGQMDNLATKLGDAMANAEARYGSILDYELLRNDTVGDSVVRLMFIQRREFYGVNWQFVWYRGAGGWLLSGFRFGDDLGALF